jgi:lipopolysaccharide/colanic/teichoic acid biosynthesis glycosyltransferase
MMADLSDLGAAQAAPDYGAGVLCVAERQGLYFRVFKRSFDVVAVLASAVVVLPLVLLLGLLVSLDGGPALYWQNRVGRGGRIFRIWKLRTMDVDAERLLEAHLAADPAARAEWDRTQKLKDDPRITRIGRLLRKSSLDELPQLWNVLVGEMSLVGPRPMLPEQTELYPGKAYNRAYCQLRPGVTGLWQISDRNESAFDTRAYHDTLYFRRMSLGTDLFVLLVTVAVVLRGTGH